MPEYSDIGKDVPDNGSEDSVVVILPVEAYRKRRRYNAFLTLVATLAAVSIVSGIIAGLEDGDDDDDNEDRPGEPAALLSRTEEIYNQAATTTIDIDEYIEGFFKQDDNHTLFDPVSTQTYKNNVRGNLYTKLSTDNPEKCHITIATLKRSLQSVAVALRLAEAVRQDYVAHRYKIRCTLSFLFLSGSSTEGATWFANSWALKEIPLWGPAHSLSSVTTFLSIDNVLCSGVEIHSYFPSTREQLREIIDLAREYQLVTGSTLPDAMFGKVSNPSAPPHGLHLPFLSTSCPAQGSCVPVLYISPQEGKTCDAVVDPRVTAMWDSILVKWLVEKTFQTRSENSEDENGSPAPTNDETLETMSKTGVKEYLTTLLGPPTVSSETTMRYDVGGDGDPYLFIARCGEGVFSVPGAALLAEMVLERRRERYLPARNIFMFTFGPLKPLGFPKYSLVVFLRNVASKHAILPYHKGSDVTEWGYLTDAGLNSSSLHADIKQIHEETNVLPVGTSVVELVSYPLPSAKHYSMDFSEAVDERRYANVRSSVLKWLELHHSDVDMDTIVQVRGAPCSAKGFFSVRTLENCEKTARFKKAGFTVAEHSNRAPKGCSIHLSTGHVLFVKRSTLTASSTTEYQLLCSRIGKIYDSSANATLQTGAERIVVVGNDLGHLPILASIQTAVNAYLGSSGKAVSCVFKRNEQQQVFSSSIVISLGDLDNEPALIDLVDPTISTSLVYHELQGIEERSGDFPYRMFTGKVAVPSLLNGSSDTLHLATRRRDEKASGSDTSTASQLTEILWRYILSQIWEG